MMFDCCALEDGPSLGDRLQVAHTVNNPLQHAEVPAEAAGQAAEKAVFESADEARRSWFRDRSGLVFQALRIPDPDSGRRHEIDVLCVSRDSFLLLEVKNWSGHLDVGPRGEWLQTRRSGDCVQHSPAVRTLKRKARALRQHLGASGGALPVDFPLHCRVIFTNSGLQLSDAILALPEVLPPAHWQSHVQHQPGPVWLPEGTGALTAAVRLTSSLFGGAARLSRPQLLSACDVLSACSSWDTLTLSGGRVLRGDWCGFQLPPGHEADVDLKRAVSRRDTEQVQLLHYRGGVWGSLAYWNALTGSLPTVRVKVFAREATRGCALWPAAPSAVVDVPVVGSAVRFHVAGAPSPVNVELNEVEGLTLAPPGAPTPVKIREVSGPDNDYLLVD